MNKPILAITGDTHEGWFLHPEDPLVNSCKKEIICLYAVILDIFLMILNENDDS